MRHLPDFFPEQLFRSRQIGTGDHNQRRIEQSGDGTQDGRQHLRKAVRSIHRIPLLLPGLILNVKDFPGEAAGPVQQMPFGNQSAAGKILRRKTDVNQIADILLRMADQVSLGSEIDIIFDQNRYPGVFLNQFFEIEAVQFLDIAPAGSFPVKDHAGIGNGNGADMRKIFGRIDDELQ